MTVVAENSKLLQTNRACVYFDVNIDVGFDFGDGLRLKFRHQMLVRPLQYWERPIIFQTHFLGQRHP